MAHSKELVEITSVGSDHYRAMATTTAPPTTAMISLVRPAVAAAAPVCRPGSAVVVSVGVGWMTVTAVTVLRLPLGRVVVLS